MDVRELIKDLKEEINQKNELEKNASNNDLDLSDLEIELPFKKEEEKIEKIASELDNVSSLEELVKIAEEAGHKDIANLVKIADFIADKVVSKIKQLGE